MLTGSLRSRCHEEGRTTSEETEEEKLLEDRERLLDSQQQER